MKIDVIITCFNEDEYICQALDSVISQTYWHVINEVLIIDDGSSDNTSSLIKPYIDSYENIKYIYQNNKGLAEARNRGIIESKAEYISFLDADDMWCEEKIEKQYYILNSLKSIDLIYTSVYHFYENSNIKEKFTPVSYYGKGNLLKFFINDAPIYPSTVVLKRKVLDLVGDFDSYFHLAQDTDLWYRIIAEGEVYHLNDYLIKRRVREKSLGENLDKKIFYLKSSSKKIQDMYPFLKKYNSIKESNLYLFKAKKHLQTNQIICFFISAIIACRKNFINMFKRLINVITR